MARILVVDDNLPNLELMLYLLRNGGHDPVGFTRSLDGLAAAEREAFDLVLTDVLMPEMDGYEFARRYRKRADRAKLLAVTALAMVGDRERVLAGGFDGYIAKPIDPVEFVPLIERYLSWASARA